MHCSYYTLRKCSDLIDWVLSDIPFFFFRFSDASSVFGCRSVSALRRLRKPSSWFTATIFCSPVQFASRLRCLHSHTTVQVVSSESGLRRRTSDLRSECVPECLPSDIFCYAEHIGDVETIGGYSHRKFPAPLAFRHSGSFSHSQIARKARFPVL